VEEVKLEMNKQKTLSLLMFFSGFVWLALSSLIFREHSFEKRFIATVFPWLAMSIAGAIFYPQKNS